MIDNILQKILIFCKIMEQVMLLFIQGGIIGLQERGKMCCVHVGREGGGGCAGDASLLFSRSAPLQNNKVFWRKNIFVLFKYIGGIS